MKKIKSARGAVVDFDLIKLKEQMSAAPAPSDVKQRQEFIERRLRRKRRVVSPPAPKVQQVEVEPGDMPAAEESQAMLNVPTPPPLQEKKKARPRKTTQKARPTQTEE